MSLWTTPANPSPFGDVRLDAARLREVLTTDVLTAAGKATEEAHEAQIRPFREGARRRERGLY
jgi:hypothetical protein